MTTPSVICEQWDVVVVPFPFTEKATTKRRPALVLSKRAFNKHGYTLLAMITTQTHAPWPGDTAIQEPQATGLRVPCTIRLKVFTIDNRLITKKIGHLSPTDCTQVERQLRQHLV